MIFFPEAQRVWILLQDTVKLQTTNHIVDPTVWQNCIHLNRMKTLKQLEQLLVPSGASCLNYPCLHPLFLSPPPQLPDPQPEHGKSQPQTVACPGRNANTRRTEAWLAPESPRKENNHKNQMPPSRDKKKKKRSIKLAGQSNLSERWWGWKLERGRWRQTSHDLSLGQTGSMARFDISSRRTQRYEAVLPDVSHIFSSIRCLSISKLAV